MQRLFTASGTACSTHASHEINQEPQLTVPKSIAAHELQASLYRLLDHLTQGLLLLGEELNVLYANPYAYLFLQELLSHDENPQQLPRCLVELCQNFLRESDNCDKTLLMDELVTLQGAVLQVQVSWFWVSPLRKHLLITLVDRSIVGQQALWFDQQIYGLTDRETRVWQLLQNQASYQEIAHCLEISLNTVKTHIKNIYAKRRIPRKRSPVWVPSQFHALNLSQFVYQTGNET
ncbi:MAG: helix-turn-helix transcriptional regulator [Synechococcales bacterium]|nr:helix-turn-helix transcriptional regulator [Synechococcales bacterium]